MTKDKALTRVNKQIGEKKTWVYNLTNFPLFVAKKEKEKNSSWAKGKNVEKT